MVYDHFILYLEPDGWAANFVLPSTILSTLLTVKERKTYHYIDKFWPAIVPSSNEALCLTLTQPELDKNSSICVLVSKLMEY